MDLLREITVEPIGFMYMLAIFAEYTIVQDLVFVKICLNDLNKTQINDCIISESSDQLSSIQTESAQQLLYYNSILYLSSIMSSCIAGSYGDKYGRIVPLLIPSTFSLITQIIFSVCSFNINSNIFIFVYICAFISGLSGGASSLFANTFGFISDITHDNNRTRRITILEASLFCGGFAGFSIVGLISKMFANYKYLVCFSLIFIIHSFILIYILLRLRHVVVTDQSVRPVVNAFHIKSVFNMFSDVIKTVFKKRDSNIRKLIFLLIVCFICVSFGTAVQTNLLFLYVRNGPLLWDTSLYGYFSGIKFGVSGLALCFLPVLQSYCFPNISDSIIAIIGLFSRTCGLIMIGFATNNIFMFLSIIVLIFSEYPLPAIRSILSKLVAIDEKGKVFASLASLQNICLLTAAIIFPMVYKFEINSNSFRGLCFELSAVLQFIALLIFIYIRKELKSMQMWSQIESNSEAIDILAED